MSDLISRQAVVDATKTVMKDTLDSLPTRLVDGEEIYDVRTSELDLILGINKALQNAIKALPSETHEIPTDTHGVCLDELISREAAIDALKENMVEMGGDDWCEIGVHKDDIEAIINALPSANKSGKWIETEYGDGDISYMCDQCKSEFVLIDGTPADNEYNFCPHCGADMRGESDD